MLLLPGLVFAGVDLPGADLPGALYLQGIQSAFWIVHILRWIWGSASWVLTWPYSLADAFGILQVSGIRGSLKLPLQSRGDGGTGGRRERGGTRLVQAFHPRPGVAAGLDGRSGRRARKQRLWSSAWEDRQPGGGMIRQAACRRTGMHSSKRPARRQGVSQPDSRTRHGQPGTRYQGSQAARQECRLASACSSLIWLTPDCSMLIQIVEASSSFT